MKAGTAETIKPQMTEVSKHAQQADDAGKQGDAKAVVKHAKTTLDKARRRTGGLERIPQ